MRKLIYNLKVLLAAISIYCRYDNVCAQGAAEQARVIVDAVNEECERGKDNERH
jgi:hypothetical protein